MEIRVIKDIQKMDALQEFWERNNFHPDSDYGQFKLICQLRSEVECPYVIVAEHKDEIQALLVARLERTEFKPSIGYYKPVRFPARVLMVLHEGLIGREEDETTKEIVRGLRSYLKAERIDVIIFHLLRENSPLFKALMTHGKNRWWQKKGTHAIHWEMNILGERDLLLKKYKSKHKSWIRNRERRLEETYPGKISWQWLTQIEDVPKLCARLEEVAVNTYQRALGVGFMNDEEHRQRFSLFADRRQLRVQILEIEGTPQAFWVGIVYKGIFHSLETGYNPAFRNYEPGTLILLRVVEGLRCEEISKFDFGLGNAFYKERFGDRSWQEATVYMFAPTIKGMTLQIGLRGFEIMHNAGSRLLKKAGLLDKIKTVWRKYLVSAKAKS